jgi:hypothetical protein
MKRAGLQTVSGDLSNVNARFSVHHSVRPVICTGITHQTPPVTIRMR